MTHQSNHHHHHHHLHFNFHRPHHHPGASTIPRKAKSTPNTPSNTNIFQYKNPNRSSISITIPPQQNEGISSPISPRNNVYIPFQSPASSSSLSSSSSSEPIIIDTPESPQRTSSYSSSTNQNNDLRVDFKQKLSTTTFNNNTNNFSNRINITDNLIFPFATSSPSTIDPTHPIYSTSPVRIESQRLLLSPSKRVRGIPKIPYKVLDAPDLVDDFYLNLVDWGSQNIISVGLGSKVYIWNAKNSHVTNLCDLGTDEMVTSVSWIKRGTHLAIGTRSGLVHIWDAEHRKRIRTMTGHDKRVGALSWNDHILTSGSRDRTILHRDVRISDHYIKRLTGHKQEVCGLKWNTDDNQLASGGNDNRLIIWDGMEEKPLYRFTDHNAAIKAISWSPHTRGLLATGGGTADRRIRFWNTLTGTCINEIDTGSQVCNLVWSKTSNELVSTHGYSQNQIVVWKYPTMQQVAVLTGHSYRVLYLAMSPNGKTIATGAGDETLRFWRVFDDENNGDKKPSSILDIFPKLR